MINMDQYEVIRTAHRVYHKSIHKIAREYGHHRRTIRKALRGEEPGYHRQSPLRHPVLENYKAIIDQWLEADRQAPVKQRHTARRIYRRLVSEYGFKGGESTLRNYVRFRRLELCPTLVETMIPLSPSCGQEAEVDWGEAEVILNHQRVTVHLFCMRSRYSGKSFIRAYPCEKQEMFLEGHQRGFESFGGVFPTLVYDNLRTAVKKILRGRSREEQESFTAFRSYYTFSARFCNPGQGHEKGGVEGLVGYARRNFLVPIPEFEHFEALNQFLLRQCQNQDQQKLLRGEHSLEIGTLFAEEKTFLLPIPLPAYRLQRNVEVKADKYQTFCLERNHYSVPPRYHGLSLHAWVGCWEIRIFYQQTLVAEHARLFGQQKWALNPFHYLESLKRKTGAFDQARPLLDWRREWPTSYEKMLLELRQSQGFSSGTRQFIEILQLHQHYLDQEVQAAVALSVESGCYGLQAVKMLLDGHGSQQLSFPALESHLIPGVTDIKMVPPDLSLFNQLMN